jgi:hypothetical protein
MKIGIISDSHDNLPKIEKAVNFFNRNKVGFVLHAGDFVAPFTIPKLKSLNCDWRGVFGNNDGERNGLANISENKIKEGPVRIELDHRKITLIHDIDKINIATEESNLIIFGHTHNPQIKNFDTRLLINPGECGGWLTDKSTVAVLDLDTLSCKIFNI